MLSEKAAIQSAPVSLPKLSSKSPVRETGREIRSDFSLLHVRLCCTCFLCVLVLLLLFLTFYLEYDNVVKVSRCLNSSDEVYGWKKLIYDQTTGGGLL